MHGVTSNDGINVMMLGENRFATFLLDTDILETVDEHTLTSKLSTTPYHIWNFDDFFANQVIVHNSSGATAMISLNQGDQYCCPDPGPPGAGNWTRLANCI